MYKRIFFNGFLSLLLSIITSTAWTEESKIPLPPPISHKQQKSIEKLSTQSNEGKDVDMKVKPVQNSTNPPLSVETKKSTIRQFKNTKTSDGIKVSIGVVQSEKIYFPLANGICLFMNSKDHHSCSVKSYNTPVDAITGVLNGDVSFIIVRSPWQKYIMDGNKPFDNNNQHKKLRFVMSFYNEPLGIVARKNAHIRTLDDMRGKTVNFNPQNTITRITMEEIMKAKGWSEGVFASVMALEPGKQTMPLCNGDVDIMTIIGERANTFLKEVTRLCEVNFIGITSTELESFKTSNDGL